MTDPQQALIEQQIHELANLKEDDLYRKLGMQLRQAELAAAQNPDALEEARAKGAFDEAEGVEMGLGENLREFGRRWWGEIEPKLFAILCGADNPQRAEILANLPVAKGGTAPTSGSASADHIALVLAPLLISVLPFGLSIIATTAATIAAKMLISTGLKTTCEMWEESMAERSKAAKAATPASGDQPATAEASSS